MQSCAMINVLFTMSPGKKGQTWIRYKLQSNQLIADNTNWCTAATTWLDPAQSMIDQLTPQQKKHGDVNFDGRTKLS